MKHVLDLLVLLQDVSLPFVHLDSEHAHVLLLFLFVRVVGRLVLQLLDEVVLEEGR